MGPRTQSATAMQYIATDKLLRDIYCLFQRQNLYYFYTRSSLDPCNNGENEIVPRMHPHQVSVAPEKVMTMTRCTCLVTHCRNNMCCCVKVNMKFYYFCECNETMCEIRIVKFRSLMSLTVNCQSIQNKTINSECVFFS